MVSPGIARRNLPTHPAGSFEGNENMKTFINMLKDQSGASAAEYALILAIVGTAIAAAAVLLGGAIGDAMTSAADCIDQTTAACKATPAATS
jgi:pilus assembly protein Flp/PilA